MVDSKTVLVPLAPGFEEIEAVTIIDVLRRAGLEVTTAGLNDTAVEGAHNIRIECDTLLSELDSNWDAIVLPGGLPGSNHLRDDDKLKSLLADQAKAGRIVAAICAAPIALEAAGVLKGRRATSYPGFGEQMPSANYVEDTVCIDGNITTSRGPGTALRFALSLVAQLASEETAGELSKGMLANS
ncbi:MAG: DJ-1/PfpI family protein [Planctomycetota bacterium]|nr:DJ-1/PfpI family protein [Planctomycetota bacterium]